MKLHPTIQETEVLQLEIEITRIRRDSFTPGENLEFLTLDFANDVSLVDGDIQSVSDQGTGANDFAALDEDERPVQIVADVDYNNTDSAAFSSNQSLTTVLPKLDWRFMHDGTTHWVLHMVYNPALGGQVVMKSQSNSVTTTGFTMKRASATANFSVSNGNQKLHDVSTAGWFDDTPGLVQVILNPNDIGSENRIRIAVGRETKQAKLAGDYELGDSHLDSNIGGPGFSGSVSFISIKKDPTTRYTDDLRVWLARNKGITA